MKSFIKKLFIGLFAVIMAFSAVACGGQGNDSNDEEEEENKTKTKLSVYNFDGGIGTEWLKAAEKRFEQLYADVSFEEGKLGVNVEVYPGKLAQDTVASSPYDVFFTESVYFNDLVGQGLIMDISDVVTSPLTNVKGCSESGSIEDKLFPEQREALTALDGHYYVLPHYECYSGVSYDKDLFDRKSLFIKEGAGTTQFTNLAGQLSVGPDGIRNTYDDGLPSSYEEFYKLLERMVKLNIVPFIYTGLYPTYTNNFLSGAWAAYCGKDEWMLNVNFNSNYDGKNVSTGIITGFNGSTPIIENKTISAETGYLMSQQAGKYYALEFLSTIASKAENFSDDITKVLSHLDAQQNYIFSALEGNKPIAMIIEGSYWYNEAKDALEASANLYPDEGSDRNFSFMPLPVQVSGQVTEGNGKKNTLFDYLNSYCFVSSQIKDDPVKVDLAKKFLQFLYTDAELLHFTETTSIFKGVSYNVSGSVFEQMSKYAYNMYVIRSNSDIIHPISGSKIFVNAQSKFYYNVDTTCWSSKVDGKPYKYPLSAFTGNSPVSAKDYFLGMTTSQDAWNGSYSKYF